MRFKWSKISLSIKILKFANYAKLSNKDVTQLFIFFVWLSNPMLMAAWFLFFKRKYLIALILSVLPCLVMLFSMGFTYLIASLYATFSGLFAGMLQVAQAIFTPDKPQHIPALLDSNTPIISLGLGFWLWLFSGLLTLIVSCVYLYKNTKSRAF